jgi:proteasome lid subunit RPN8/RPN11
MLRIRSKDLDDIVYHCVREQPIEACGILSGKSAKVDASVVREVLKIYRCLNELNSRTEYRIAGEEQIRVFDDIENSGSEVLGFYHSHPCTDSQPSSIDKEKGNYIGYSHVIVSLCPTKVSSWVLEEDGFKEEQIHIVPD